MIFKFGIPKSIIIDLGSNFTSAEFFDFCEQKCIQVKYASVAHPRANRQVERANGMILEALRKKVFDKKKSLQENGSWSCLMLSGVCEPSPVEPCMIIFLSLWYTDQRQCCQQTWPLEHPD
jgi:transposase InsO family protein